ncbi:SDR family oxidoreductase [Cytophagaceae bacterium ABcell3]|nr:SDR family oxidoreductase [Cytophagaceae bacterium ABcell3]
MKRFDKKVIVITGASSGIGRATALEFAKQGASVVLAARRGDALEQVAEECRSLGGKAMAVALDVTYENDVKNMASRAIHEFGHIDVWVNNAAVSLMGPFEDMPTEDMKRVMDINLFGYINGAKAVLPHFRQRKKGTLINVSSAVSITGQPFSMGYTTSKFAIRGFSLSLEQELSDEKDIHVCTVYPGVIDTPIFNQAANYMGRAVKAPGPAMDAKEVAEAIVSLAIFPRKEVSVGAVSKVSGVLKTLVPNVYDKQYRKVIFKNHFNEHASEPSKGNLYEPMRQYAQVSGGWQNNKEEQEKNGIGKKILAGTVLAGAALGAFLLAGKNGQPVKEEREVAENPDNADRVYP